MTDVTTQRVHFRTCTLCEAMCGLRIETRDEEVRDIFEANFFGTLNTIRPVVPGMVPSAVARTGPEWQREH